MMRRRQLLAAAAVLCACDHKSEAPPKIRESKPVDGWEEMAFAASDHYKRPQMAAVLKQHDAPLLIALHGRGEAGRGLEVGARGWRDDYDLDVAHKRLMTPPLTQKDFHNFVTSPRLKQINDALAAQPYRGVAVACPYSPALQDRTIDGAQPFARFLTRDLIPKVRTKLGLSAANKRIGIDGVSMGGRLSLLIGLSHPEVFGAVGALQPAIAGHEANWLADMAKKAAVPLRLVTSADDPFRGAVRALSKALDERSVPHTLVETPGPHDYIWNRGPGSYEMLFWHDRVLRGLPAR
jgi:dienelactone hydrolase